MAADTATTRTTAGARTPRQAPAMELAELIADRQTRIVVCCGAGGVGKTTTSAALGLAAAEAGRTVVVLTIDPARRLAQSLGLTELDNEPRKVDVPGAPGELHAMMLDMKRTFDEIVTAHSTPERAQQILDNPFYQALSSSFAGTQEYMAMEKLGQLRASDQWDLIIVDTPPSRSALDFLDAPNRMGRFLDGTMIRLLMAPSRAGFKFASAGFLLFSRIVSKILGGQLLRDISAFVSALDTMFGGFRERATATFELLRRPGTWFVVVAAPEPDALREASYFVDRLSAEGMPLAGLVVNRTHPPATTALSATRAEGAAEEVAESGDDGAALAAAALRVHAERMQLATREQHLADRFTSAHPDVALRTVPAAAGDVHDLEGLRAMAAALTGPDHDTPTGTPRTRVLPARRG
ncbi:ArsA family ATPase [Blastococcus sp. MG754426]|uniref:ArsA family ATPase n=1 Tax=unclassified Blastococcus TaxID=2619396 RepID=UPI001EF032C1|nr:MULTISPECIES: ArsA family ATPase [unclassified Blastococcus]MCF6509860.1 ArsA family ATPase [Blastococcus sp. MG754426]MCF6514280.1 ArsA family ATPase [Blastococcus sp. MG754427]MCF6737413.1 ArsA family ATPase [Blastococcus sp. KM273129]